MYILINIKHIPVHQTSFAHDRIFGYKTSDLSLWLEEKSLGIIKAKDVWRLKLEYLEAALHSEEGMKSLLDWLSALKSNSFVVVDAESISNLVILGKAVKLLVEKKRFLFRSAASFINALASLPEKDYQINDLVALRSKDKAGKLKPGLVMVGSHVQLADEQLDCLLTNNQCFPIELPLKEIEKVLSRPSSDFFLKKMKTYWIKQINIALDSDKTPVLYTSRGEIFFSDRG